MFAKDIMTTNVVTVTPKATIKEAITLLVNIEISGLIVLDEANEVVGVISEKDLLVAFDFLEVTKATIQDFISKKVISVQEDTPIEEISRVLIEGNIRRVPVLKDKKLVGVVSRRDILKYILNKK